MHTLRLVIAATNSSRGSENAIDRAIVFAKVHDARLELLHACVGDPAEAIAARVSATDADVVVIARRSDPTDPGVGSAVMHVLQHAPCLVLVVRTALPAGNLRGAESFDVMRKEMRSADREFRPPVQPVRFVRAASS